MRILVVLAVSFFTLLPFMSLPAQADGDQSIQEQIEELKKNIEELEQQMNIKAYEATAKDSKAWYNKIKVKTKKGASLTFQTADSNYKLRMRFFGQFLANYTDPDTDEEGFGFSVRNLWLIWDGNAFAPWMKYTIQYDLAGGALKDMRLSFAKNKMFIPTVGQYKVPFSREFLTSITALQLVGTSIIDDYFRYGRDIGGGVYGFLGDGMIRYDAGVFQGEGANQKNDKGDTGMLWAGRVQAAIIGGKAKSVKENFAKRPTLMVGAAVAGIDVEDGNDGNVGIPSGERDLESGRVTSFTADINYRDPRFNLTGEYVGRWVNPDDAGVGTAYDSGFRVQGGFFLLPKRIELASRYAMVMFDDDANVLGGNDLDNVWTFTQGLSYYLSGNHKWKIQLDYTFQREEDLTGVESDESTVRAQVQTYF
ncbi:MAG: hypothetical protein F4193_07550 [Candidatus Dadabacteria bacterium]|nr:hypothetical protein [Candidatus Dadabacteria bacterium]